MQCAKLAILCFLIAIVAKCIVALEVLNEQPRAERKRNLDMCLGANVTCTPCMECFPGGWCINNPGIKPKCICNYGFTGANSEWLPNTKSRAWGFNRIRADDCLTSCNYTHHVRWVGQVYNSGFFCFIMFSLKTSKFSMCFILLNIVTQFSFTCKVS